LKITLPAGGTDTWSATPLTVSTVLTGTPVKYTVSAAVKKAAKGTIWVDDIQVTLD